jgi:hypothetical protein
MVTRIFMVTWWDDRSGSNRFGDERREYYRNPITAAQRVEWLISVDHLTRPDLSTIFVDESDPEPIG